MTTQLLNTLYVTSNGAFARLDGDTVRVDADGVKLLQVPLLHLGAIVLFGGASLSPALMGRCAEDGREITFLDYYGRFKCRVVGPVSGNVLLRKAQYEVNSDMIRSLEIAMPIVAGKVKNSRNTVLRAAREHRDLEQAAALKTTAQQLGDIILSLPNVSTLDQLRGFEGQAAAKYFGTFGAMITQPKAEFAFTTRTRRPPRDRVNALLSFVYALLTSDCVAAVEGVGLDPQFGYLHTIRPGRPALALDLVEEFRSHVGDRLVLTLINKRQIDAGHFEHRPGENVLLTADGRKVVLTAYQNRKKEPVSHALLNNPVPVGLIPHIQARVLARHLRGDIPTYVPYIAR